jgi:membrane fusion protein, multidrug efflux system
MIKRMLIMLLCVGVVFGGIFSYKAFATHMMEQAMSARKPPPVVVSATTARKQAWQPRFNAVGTVRAIHGVDVTTEIAGQVQAIYFKSGDNVREGQQLVQLNADVDKALLQSLKANAELARTTYTRDRRQFDVKAISRETLDVARADLESKQAQVEEQDAAVAKKTIRAPFSGRIGIGTIDPGQYLKPGDKIVTLQSVDTVYVDFLVAQQQVARMALGQTVAVTSDTYPDRVFNGKITAINPKIDPQTRNIQIEATLPNSDHALLPGMFTTVQIAAGHVEQYITLPQTAVTYNPYGATVYLVAMASNQPQGESEGTARQTFVTTGATRGDQIAILKGVKAGDTVVTSGQLKLKNGSRVVINNQIQPSNNPAPEPADD